MPPTNDETVGEGEAFQIETARLLQGKEPQAKEPYEKPRIDVLTLGQLLDEAEKLQGKIEDTLAKIASSVHALVEHLEQADLDCSKLNGLVSELQKVQSKASFISDVMAQDPPREE